MSNERDAARVEALLNTPEVAGLICGLDETRWTGRPGYAIRSMIGLALVKGLYCLPTWSRTVALVQDHAGLREVLGNTPSSDAAYRFADKLGGNNALADCLDRVLIALHDANPEIGKMVAIDGSDLPAYANGQKEIWTGIPRTHFSDPDASWGYRNFISTRHKGSFYGYKLHATVCTATELPVAWVVTSANVSENPQVPILLDDTIRRGFAPGMALLDAGYDAESVYDAVEARNIRPLIPLTGSYPVVPDEAKPPICAHGEWAFGGADAKRGMSKWRCPAGKCKPASKWIKASRLHPLVPRFTPRWKALYNERKAVERTFGRLKHEWGLLPLRVRGIEAVSTHVNLTMLAQLSSALLDIRRPRTRDDDDLTFRVPLSSWFPVLPEARDVDYDKLAAAIVRQQALALTRPPARTSDEPGGDERMCR